MPEEHVDICDSIEDVLCKGLGIEPDQHTYEVAVDIFETAYPKIFHNIFDKLDHRV